MKSSVAWLSLGLLIFSPGRINAETYFYQATGPTRESIQPVVDQFRNDIVYGRGGSALNPPTFLGSYRLATFDDAAAANKTVRAASVVSGDLIFRAATDSLLVSATEGDGRLFGDLGEKYPGWFSAYSGASVLSLAALGTESATGFVVSPDSAEPSKTQSNAFGAVFVDVDDSASISVSWLFPSGHHVVSVATSPGDGQFSFLGILMAGDEFPFASAFNVDLPGLPIEPPLSTEDATHDVVAIDDVIIGTAPPVPEPSSGVLLALALLLLAAKDGLSLRLNRSGRE